MTTNTNSEETQAQRAQHLMETGELAAKIEAHDATLRVIDVRGYVRVQTDAEGVQEALYVGAPEEYAASHIPGAIYLDWTRDIVDETDPVPAQIAPPEKISRVLGAAGIGDEADIVIYDQHPASQFATRLWWVLRCYGHTNARVLNGGWPKWNAEQRPVTSELPHYAPALFTTTPQPEWYANAEDVLAMLAQPDIALLDARDEGQYTGRVRRGSRGGRIPGAKHLPREAFFAPDGTFLPPEQLRTLVEARNIQPEQRVVAYCNGGVAATSVLFTLSMLGYPHLTNYDGSWNEWTERAELPTEM